MGARLLPHQSLMAGQLAQRNHTNETLKAIQSPRTSAMGGFSTTPTNAKRIPNITDAAPPAPGRRPSGISAESYAEDWMLLGGHCRSLIALPGDLVTESDPD